MLRIKSYFTIFTAIYLSFIAKLSFAQEAGGEGAAITIPNPLAPASNVMDIIQNIINALTIYIAPPIVALMVLYGAFQILFAGANPDKFTEGKRTILYAAIGYAIILIANGITLVINNLLSG